MDSILVVLLIALSAIANCQTTVIQAPQTYVYAHSFFALQGTNLDGNTQIRLDGCDYDDCNIYLSCSIVSGSPPSTTAPFLVCLAPGFLTSTTSVLIYPASNPSNKVALRSLYPIEPTTPTTMVIKALIASGDGMSNGVNIAFQVIAQSAMAITVVHTPPAQIQAYIDNLEALHQQIIGTAATLRAYKDILRTLGQYPCSLGTCSSVNVANAMYSYSSNLITFTTYISNLESYVSTRNVDAIGPIISSMSSFYGSNLYDTYPGTTSSIFTAVSQAINVPTIADDVINIQGGQPFLIFGNNFGPDMANIVVTLNGAVLSGCTMTTPQTLLTCTAPSLGTEPLLLMIVIVSQQRANEKYVNYVGMGGTAIDTTTTSKGLVVNNIMSGVFPLVRITSSDTSGIMYLAQNAQSDAVLVQILYYNVAPLVQAINVIPALFQMLALLTQQSELFHYVLPDAYFNIYGMCEYVTKWDEKILTLQNFLPTYYGELDTMISSIQLGNRNIDLIRQIAQDSVTIMQMVRNISRCSNYLLGNIDDYPHMLSVSPSTSIPTGGGTIGTVHGYNLGSDKSSMALTVYYYKPVDVITLGAKSFTFVYPSGSGMGNISLIVKGKAIKPDLSYYYSTPVFSSLSVNEGNFNGGGRITITGNNFGDELTSVYVVFNGGSPNVLEVSNSYIVFQQPAGTGSNIPIYLSVSFVELRPHISFKYTAIPSSFVDSVKKCRWNLAGIPLLTKDVGTTYTYEVNLYSFTGFSNPCTNNPNTAVCRLTHDSIHPISSTLLFVRDSRVSIQYVADYKLLITSTGYPTQIQITYSATTQQPQISMIANNLITIVVGPSIVTC